jgi:hypothetical protein
MESRSKRPFETPILLSRSQARSPMRKFLTTVLQWLLRGHPETFAEREVLRHLLKVSLSPGPVEIEENCISIRAGRISRDRPWKVHARLRQDRHSVEFCQQTPLLNPSS